MSIEAPKRGPGFGFTEDEELWDVVHDRRLMQLMTDEKTRIHKIEVTSNTFGEFLFLTLSRPDDPEGGFVAFFGLGFHDGRDQWITDAWFWYRSSVSRDVQVQSIPRDVALARLDERRGEVLGYAAHAEPQSERGKLFELLADLTDEDGAWTEMEDWGDDFLDAFDGD